MPHSHDARHGHSGQGTHNELLALLGLSHGHSHSPAAGRELEGSAKGISALKLSLLLLGLSGGFQFAIVLASGSAALLADSVHNISDALTSLPLWMAFTLSRRPPTHRYTYGFGRAEDLAGALIVLLILASGCVAAYESYARFVDSSPIRNVEWVLAAALIGFAGNEAAAIVRIRTGREIGSAALVADGQHARIDGLTSLAVLAGALGVLAGFPLADPIVGALISVMILLILKDTAVTVWYRLMDAVDPALTREIWQAAETVVTDIGALGVEALRLRWVGHQLHAELRLLVRHDLTTSEAHRLAEATTQALIQAQPDLSMVRVQVAPQAGAPAG